MVKITNAYRRWMMKKILLGILIAIVIMIVDVVLSFIFTHVNPILPIDFTDKGGLAQMLMLTLLLSLPWLFLFICNFIRGNHAQINTEKIRNKLYIKEKIRSLLKATNFFILLRYLLLDSYKVVYLV